MKMVATSIAANTSLGATVVMFAANYLGIDLLAAAQITVEAPSFFMLWWATNQKAISTILMVITAVSTIIFQLLRFKLQRREQMLKEMEFDHKKKMDEMSASN